MSKKFKRKVYKMLEDTSLVNVKIGKYTDEKWTERMIEKAAAKAELQLKAKQERSEE